MAPLGSKFHTLTLKPPSHPLKMTSNCTLSATKEKSLQEKNNFLSTKSFQRMAFHEDLNYRKNLEAKIFNLISIMLIPFIVILSQFFQAVHLFLSVSTFNSICFKFEPKFYSFRKVWTLEKKEL